ncbi:MAG: aminotransferase class I/II-fold pyridoxal phosphate-dependent enzyme [Bacillota bacterium]|nr:aminotransferase class I/II-fold pyridoxal phosphate-dependent enzyme [Bacillota bacterium]MDW7682618.1 aminotransferase class I/II-fold pyridoxal phosphate-dependent enzyme [Bacillota bacterium]
MDRETFRKFGYEFVDWVADYFENVDNFPVRSKAVPGEILERLPLNPPMDGEPMENIFTDFKEIIMPGITHWQHPGWFAYFPANNSPASVLAELLTAGIGAQGMIWQTSPAATELEEVVMNWLRQMLGLPEGMVGVIQDTASTATLCALLTARESATGFAANTEGAKMPLVVYASEEAHSSVDKAVKIAGYGKQSLRSIPTDDNFAMNPEQLEAAILRDMDAGLIPACVVATVGTTSSTAIDSLEQIGRICRKHNIWLHVDAAFAGTAAILEEKRWLIQGAELIDSFVFNPHKWMLTNFDCSAYFVKDPGLLVKTFEIHPEYLKTSADSQVKNYRDWGIQLGRRFRALKLWFVIRSYGVRGIQEMVREHIRLAELFKGWVAADERFEVLAPVNVSLVCFRLRGGTADAELEELNRELLERVNTTGTVYLTHTSLKGRFAIRMMVGQRTTDENHVREAWEIIREKAGELQQK